LKAFIPKVQRAEGSGAGYFEPTTAQYSAALGSLMYNGFQLSLTHTQLKVGTPTSVTPLTSSESSQHNPKIEKGTNKWQKQEQ
jgi:hypothetical protein